MHFDWYQATIPQDPGVICDQVTRALGVYKQRDLGSGRHGYMETTLFLDPEGGTLATLLHGSESAKPNLTGSGHHAEAVADLVRSKWPQHRVTRVDVAEDLVAEGLFETISGTVKRITSGSGMSSGLRITPDDTTKGSTYYVGAKTSTTRLRVYEKGRQLAALGGWTGEPPDPNHVRVELQFRPNKDAKSRAAKLQPREFWGVAPWTKEIAATVLHVDVPRLKMTHRPVSDLHRTFDWIMSQYHRTFMGIGESDLVRKHGLLFPDQEDIIDAAITAIRAKIKEEARERFLREQQREP